MEQAANTVIRYSEAFKQKVIQEMESQQLTRAEIVRKYDVSATVVNQWLKRFKRHHLFKRVVRVERPGEIKPSDVIKELKRQKQELESALAQTQLKLIAMESLVEVAEQHYKIEIKKNLVQSCWGCRRKSQRTKVKEKFWSDHRVLWIQPARLVQTTSV